MSLEGKVVGSREGVQVQMQMNGVLLLVDGRLSAKTSLNQIIRRPGINIYIYVCVYIVYYILYIVYGVYISDKYTMLFSLALPVSPCLILPFN